MLPCIFSGAESIAEVNVNLWWFVDTAVVSEVLLFRLHIIYSLFLGSVLQPGDGPTDPLQQLEAERKNRRKQSGKIITRHLARISPQSKHNLIIVSTV